jgi:hypothetical protein
VNLLRAGTEFSSFGHGLSELGYTVGCDATVEAHIAEGQYERLPALARKGSR